MGKVFGKACRILGSEERKDRSVDWNNILVEIIGLLPFSLFSLTDSCSFWFGSKDLFNLHRLASKVVLDH